MGDAKFARLLVAVMIGLALTAGAGVYALLRPRPYKIPAAPDAYTVVQYRQDMLKFARRTVVEPYAKVGVRDAAWDDAATRFLERSALTFSGQLDPPSHEKLAEEGKALREQGCADPMVMYCYGVALHELGRLAAAEPIVRRAVEGFDKTPYPRARACFAAARLSNIYDELGKPEEEGRWREVAIRWFGEAGSEIREADHEPTAFLDLVAGRWDDVFDKHWRQLYQALQQNPKAHPYLVDLVGGWCNIEEAWESRGGDWASEVTEQGWEGFYRHLTEAEKLLTRAWEKYPHYPEAPGHMIQVVMGQSEEQTQRKERLWFERSIAAHLDHALPYHQLLWALRPRWGGSHKEMYAVGKACLETGRFDTNVPRWYLQSVYDIWEDSERESDVWQWAGVYENLTEMCQGYIKEAKTERQRDYYRTLLAQVSWFTGHEAEARRAFAELGDKAQPEVFADWNLHSSLEDARGAVFAGDEVDPAKLKRAGTLMKRGKYAEARAVFQQLLPQAKSKYATDYLRKDLLLADQQARYQDGLWVSIQPDAALTGWVQEQGRWEVEADGALKGTADGEGFYLANYSNFGGRLEIRGEIEFLTSPTDDGPQEAGLFLDSGDTNDDDYGYDFVAFCVSPTAGTVYVARRKEEKSRVVEKVEVGRQVQFSIQLQDGVISTWLDGRPVHRQVKIKKGVTPSKAGIGINNSCPGGVCRFRNLQIRRLIAKMPASTPP